MSIIDAIFGGSAAMDELPVNLRILSGVELDFIGHHVAACDYLHG